MKLCIPVATPDGLAAALESDFGAAQHLIVLESDSDQFAAVDRAQPERIDPELVSGIQGVICSEIHPRLLFELQQNGVQVFGSEAASAAEALAQFRAGELEAVPAFSQPPEAGGCCGGHGHHHGHAHAHGEGGCCGGHAHAHGEAEHECCGGKGHDDPDHVCCGGHGHGSGGGCGGEGHGQGGCGKH